MCVLLHNPAAGVGTDMVKMGWCCSVLGLQLQLRLGRCYESGNVIFAPTCCHVQGPVLGEVFDNLLHHVAVIGAAHITCKAASGRSLKGSSVPTGPCWYAHPCPNVVLTGFQLD